MNYEDLKKLRLRPDQIVHNSPESLKLREITDSILEKERNKLLPDEQELKYYRDLGQLMSQVVGAEKE